MERRRHKNSVGQRGGLFFGSPPLSVLEVCSLRLCSLRGGARGGDHSRICHYADVDEGKAQIPNLNPSPCQRNSEIRTHDAWQEEGLTFGFPSLSPGLFLRRARPSISASFRSSALGTQPPLTPPSWRGKGSSCVIAQKGSKNALALPYLFSPASGVFLMLKRR